MTVLISDKS